MPISSLGSSEPRPEIDASLLFPERPFRLEVIGGPFAGCLGSLAAEADGCSYVQLDNKMVVPVPRERLRPVKHAGKQESPPLSLVVWSKEENLACIVTGVSNLMAAATYS